MISISECRKTLEKYNYIIEDKEIEVIRDFLTMLAVSFYNKVNNKENENEYEYEYEKSNTILSG